MARQEAPEKTNMHIPLGRAITIGILLVFIHPAATYFQEWRQSQAEKERQTTLQLIEEVLGEREINPSAFSSSNPQEIGAIQASQKELMAQVKEMDVQISELTDRVSKLTSRMISLAEASQGPAYEQLSAENAPE